MNKIVLIDNKNTKYHIVHSVNSTECERYACSQLQKYLYESLDYPIPIFSDKCSSRGPEILIGSARGNNIKNLPRFTRTEGDPSFMPIYPISGSRIRSRCRSLHCRGIHRSRYRSHSRDRTRRHR